MQQEIKYTKGEWYLQKHSDAYTNIIRCNNGKGHQTLFIASTPQSTLPEARANAKLMSAAPDLLEALQEVIAISDRNHIAWVKAKIAIEKAIGNLPKRTDEQPVEQKGNEAVNVDELWDEHSEMIDDDIDSLSRWAGSTVVDKEQFRTLVAKLWEQLNNQKQNKR